MSDRPSVLYHYCSINSFLSILNSKAIWLSDVGKSNDKKELSILRKHYYDYVYRKYQSVTDAAEKECCKFLLAVATTDGFDKSVDILKRMDLAQALMNSYKNLRAYCFCMTELKDSLGQWRGYADNGNGIAIGFSHKYLNNIAGRGLTCPINNFTMLSVSYEHKNMDDFCKVIYDACEKKSPPSFLIKSLELLFHISAFFKDKSFKEEKEWRISFTINDTSSTPKLLNFSDFEKVETEDYKKHFSKPVMRFSSTTNDLVSHIEVGLLKPTSAIKKIIIGPRSKIKENDIKQYLIYNGLLENINDKRIIVTKSLSSYR